MIIPTWLLLSILALFLFSIYDVLSRKVGVASKNTQVYSGVYNLCAAFVALWLIIIEPIPAIHLSPFIIAMTILNLVVWAIFGRMEYVVHKEIEASVLTIILKLATVISFAFGIIIFHEELTAYKIIGLLCILAANIMVVAKPKTLNLNLKKIVLALSLAVLLGIGWTLDKGVSPYYGLVIFTFIAFLSPGICGLIFPLAKKKDIIAEIKLASWRTPVLAISNVAGYALMIKALMLGEASKVIPIATATTPIVMLTCYIFLKERQGLVIKIIATLLILSGIFFLR